MAGFRAARSLRFVADDHPWYVLEETFLPEPDETFLPEPIEPIERGQLLADYYSPEPQVRPEDRSRSVSGSEWSPAPPASPPGGKTPGRHFRR